MTLNVAEILITAKDQTASGFDSAKTGIENLHSKVTALAVALSGSMFAKMMVESLDAADKIGKLAQSTGVSTEALSRMSVSAKLSDVDMETLAKSMGKLDKNLVDAANGTGTAAAAFEYLGIKAKDSHGHLKTSDQVMAEVADKFANMKDGAGKTALAMDIFGKAGAAMIPMLNGGSAALKENADLADKLGITLSKDTAAAAEAVNDRFTTMGLAGKGIANTIMQQMLPTFDSMSKVMVDTATDGEGLRAVSDGISFALKSVVSIALTASSVLADLGDGLGALAAQAVALAHLDGAAFDAIDKQWTESAAKRKSALGESLGKLWADNAPAVSKAASDAGKDNADHYGKAVKKTIAKAKDEQYAAAMAMLESELKTAGDVAKQHVKQLDAQLAAMQISERDFYSAKKELALQDLASERGYLETELALARSKNDKLKEIELQGKLERNKIAQDEAGGATAYDNKANKASMSPLEIEKKSYKDRLDLAEQYRQNKGAADENYRRMVEDAESAHAEALYKIDQDEKVKRVQGQLQYQSVSQESMTAFFAMTKGLMNSHSRAAFEIGKASAIAETTINTYKSATAAYSAMASIPVVGPALGVAAAAAAIVSGMAQVSAINSASFGAGAGGAGAGSYGGATSATNGGNATPAYPVGQAPAAPAQPAAQPVNVYVTGNVMTPDFVANTIIPEIKNQITNADVTIIDPRSRQAQMLAVPA